MANKKCSKCNVDMNELVTIEQGVPSPDAWRCPLCKRRVYALKSFDGFVVFPPRADEKKMPEPDDVLMLTGFNPSDGNWSLFEIERRRYDRSPTVEVEFHPTLLPNGLTIYTLQPPRHS